MKAKACDVHRTPLQLLNIKLPIGVAIEEVAPSDTVPLQDDSVDRAICWPAFGIPITPEEIPGEDPIFTIQANPRGLIAQAQHGPHLIRAFGQKQTIRVKIG